MILIIMRHGQAVLSDINDRDRSLTQQGIHEVRSTASSLSTRKIDCVLASPYRRAQQTGMIVAESLGLECGTIDELVPESDPLKLLDVIPDSGVVLLASHMPLVAHLTCLLCGEDTNFGASFQTGMALVLDLEVLAPGMGQLIQRIAPSV